MNYLGYSWVDMNMNLEEGLELIRKAVDLRPSDGYIVDSLGWAHYRLGRFDDAVRELERAVSLKPDDRGAERPSRRRLLARRAASSRRRSSGAMRAT